MPFDTKDPFKAIRQITDAAVKGLALDDAGNRSRAIADERASGKRPFLGGIKGNAGYSERPISIGLLGDVTKLDNGARSVKYRDGNVRKVTYTKKDLIWYTDKQGKRKALAKGGYKEFRKKAGRSTKVDNTMTGAMLRNLTYDIQIAQASSFVEIFVRPPETEKAHDTDRLRTWLDFTDQEKDEIRKIALKPIDRFFE